jgi:hypothetical protein
LQAAQRAGEDDAVEAGGAELGDERGRQAPLALDLVLVAADDGAQRGGRVEERAALGGGARVGLVGDIVHGFVSHLR